MSAPISEPGAYDGVPFDRYRGNLCVGPSLGRSDAQMLLDECPAMWWHQSYLNPARPVDDGTRNSDIGTAAHLALLTPAEWDARVRLIDADSFRTKAAREARDEARAAGQTPLLVGDVAGIASLRGALLAHPLACKAFVDGTAERTYVCRDSKTGIWLKARPDCVPNHGRWLVDLKTTGSANPRAFQRRVYDHGLHIQAAWYLHVVEQVTGARPAEFWFVVVERAPPHLLTICTLDERALSWGRIQARRAIDLFAECIAADCWPTYADRAVEIGLPSWAQFQLEERLGAGEFGEIGLVEMVK